MMDLTQILKTGIQTWRIIQSGPLNLVWKCTQVHVCLHNKCNFILAWTHIDNTRRFQWLYYLWWWILKLGLFVILFWYQFPSELWCFSGPKSCLNRKDSLMAYASNAPQKEVANVFPTPYFNSLLFFSFILDFHVGKMSRQL